MNPIPNPIAMLPVNVSPNCDIDNVTVVWLLLSVMLPMWLENCVVAFTRVVTACCEVA